MNKVTVSGPIFLIKSEFKKFCKPTMMNLFQPQLWHDYRCRFMYYLPEIKCVVQINQTL